MKYMVDIDGTICSNTNGDYEKAEPHVTRIQHFNELYNLGFEVHYWTARGGTTGKDWSELTTQQLKQWGVKYTSLSFKKPSYDLWIDDKAINVETYFNMPRGDSPRPPEFF
jgi:hypothetical protein